MHHDRQTVAWAIIWASFAVFCLSLIAVVLGGRWYLLTATDPQQATLKVVVGTVAVREAGRSDWLLAAPETPLKEGYAIRTDPTSQALITLFDQSTITLLPGTELTFSTLRLSRYSLLAPLNSYVKLVQDKGKAVVGVTSPGQGSTQFEVGVPQGSLALAEGSYTLDITGDRARVRVKEDGKAAVTAQNKTVEAEKGQRIDAYTGEPPHPPESAAIELITNGTFQDGLKGWRVDNSPGFPDGADVLGSADVIADSGTPALKFQRDQSKGTHNETYIAQDLDEDVSDLTRLQLSLELKLIKQDVSGGGYMGSEYPLLVRVHYRSDQGDTYVIRGFYYQNDSNNRTDNGVSVAQNSWITWTMPDNLMTLIPVPRKILRIEVGASGHDYTSEIRSISLKGE